jgi:hypothetical protein
VIAESAPASSLRLKARRSSHRTLRLRVILRVGGDFDVEPGAGFGTDEFDEFVGVAKRTRSRHPRRQVAAQGNELPDTVRPILVEDAANALARRTDARQVRRRGVAFALDFEHGIEGAVARRTAGTKGDGEEAGFEQRQLRARGAQLLRPSGVCGGKSSRLKVRRSGVMTRL